MSANHRFETLAELVGKSASNLLCTCGGCGRRGIVDGRRLARLFFVRRWDGKLHMIGDHLRCSTCGARPARIDPTHAAPTGPAWGPRDEAGWRRLTARLRG